MVNVKGQRRRGGELAKLKCDVVMLSDKLDDHIKSSDEKFSKMIEVMTENTVSIQALTSDSEDIIKLHRDLLGAARLGKGIQAFFLWLAKWGIVGVFIVRVLEWILEKYNG